MVSFGNVQKKHLQGQGCPFCANNQKMTFGKFIENANKIHKNKYEYIEDSYVGYNSLMTIICPIHGEFKQTPHNHLSGRQYIDFYLPEYNIAIECQGEQHFSSDNYFGSTNNIEDFNNGIKRDITKYNNCINKKYQSNIFS